ncbi:MAG: twin-arginine translocase subunit TatA, partial [Lautropia sp.]|nr:twin-arginine translocase subunit TatA [Lautropia sp.]
FKEGVKEGTADTPAAVPPPSGVAKPDPQTIDVDAKTKV